ncbi:MAG TPA: hypothetical protein EYP85_06155, partial [Armatimonadetes bacterium]|nr:hypothetical protein [Armatimonadota bacterium]
MKKLRYNSGQRRIALVTLLSFLALLYWPYGIARRHQAAQAETEVRSIYLLPLANRTEQDADLAERLTTALRLQLGPGSSITGPRPVELLRVTTENPLIELALQRGLITEEEVENPPTELTAAVEFARKLGVDSVVSGSIEEYSLSEDQEHLTIGLLLNEYPVATFTPENPEVHTYFVRGEADARRPGYILTRRQLENEAIMDTARKAAAALVSAPPPEKPKPPEKKRGRRNFLPALIGILVLTLLFNVGRGRDRAEGLAVQNLRAMPTRSSVILTWSPVGAGRASGYNIYRRIVGQRQLRTRSRQAEFQRIAFIEGGETSTWEDTSVQIGFEYEYAIAAVDLRGREGPRSTSAQATAGPGLASPPTNVQAIPGDGFIRLTWLPSPDPFVDGYNIYRRAAGGPEVLIATLPGTATEYTDTDVLNGVSYVYRIVAFMDVTAGTRSILEGTGVTTVAVTPTERPPEAPRGLVAEAGDAEVTLRWQPNLEADIDHYNIYRAQGGGRGLWGPRSRADLFGGKFGRPGRRGVRQGLTFAKIDEVPGTLTTYLDRNVTNNIAFTYRITAVDRAGNESEPSNEVTVVPNGPPPAPQGLQATGQDRQVTLRWLRLEGVPDLAGYNIYRSTTEFTARHPAEAGGITQLNLELLPPNVTTFTDLNLVNNTTFYYAVTAVDTFGVESNFSISVPATPHLPPASVSL